MALVATVVAGSSCNSSSSGKDAFIGKWRIDSMQSTDSSSIGDLMFALAFDDSASHHFEFTKDSILILSTEKPEKSDWTLDDERKQLIFTKGDTVTYSFASDSLLRLVGPDSTTLFLKKK